MYHLLYNIFLGFVDELREYFSAYGIVVEHQIMLDHTTGRSRGFGFVTFDDENSVEKIFSDGQIHELGGKQVISLGKFLRFGKHLIL